MAVRVPIEPVDEAENISLVVRGLPESTDPLVRVSEERRDEICEVVRLSDEVLLMV